MSTTIKTLYAKEEAELAIAEQRMEAAAGFIRDKIGDFARDLANIHENALWKCRYANFDAYCQERWGFTGTRGRQLVDHYDVSKNLAKMTDDGDFAVYFSTYFSEGHSRVLKQLPAEQQRGAVKAVMATAAATGEKPTARVLERVVRDFKATPDNLDRMSREEQGRVIADMEEAAEAAYVAQSAISILRLAAKRLRSVTEQARDDKFSRLFRHGEYSICGGIVGLLDVLREEVRQLEQRLAAPMLESASAAS